LVPKAFGKTVELGSAGTGAVGTLKKVARSDGI
jgi:hypothetical protein